MKAVFFLNILRDGAGMINRELGFAAELKKRGHEVTLLSYFKPEGNIGPEGVPVQTVVPSRYRSFLYRRILAFPFVVPQLIRYFLNLKPELVFVDLPHEAWWAILLRPLFHYEVIFTYHGVADSKFYQGKAAKELDDIRSFGHDMLRKADRVFVVSNFLKQETDAIGVNATRLYNGVDLQRCSPEMRIKNVGAQGPVVLFVGRYTEYKGALNVVKAFILAQQQVPEAVLVMRGYFERPEYEAEIKATIVEAALEDRVYMFGPLEGSEMMYWVNLATVFINGSVDETFCMPVLEAQACGVPCVAFAAGGVPEVIMHEQTGLLASAGNVEEMAEHLVRILSNDALRKQYREACVEHADKFTYDKLCDQLMTALERS